MVKENEFAKVVFLLLLLCSVWTIGHISENILSCNAVGWHDDNCILENSIKSNQNN